MDALATSLTQVLDLLHDDIFAAVDPLKDEEINWAHPPLSNTIGILLRHIAASERYWIGEVVGGRAIHRVRSAEFGHERLSKATLMDDLRRAHTEVHDVVERLTGPDLMAEIEVQLRGSRRRATRAWAVMYSMQHTGYHLGQIQLFKKMATTR
ncbi:MAG TPA: DinB family protein [bacterium]|nr:DinB family protein [bacterium]